MRARLFTPENRQWWTLGAAAFGLFVIMLGALIVATAIAFAAAVVAPATVRRDTLTNPSAEPA
ncbi:MAG: hypothetical protein ABR521_07745 [Gaiellaceae bacterium]